MKKLNKNQKLQKMEKFRSKILTLNEKQDVLYNKCCLMLGTKTDPKSWIFDYLHGNDRGVALEAYVNMKGEEKKLIPKAQIDFENASSTPTKKK